MRLFGLALLSLLVLVLAAPPAFSQAAPGQEEEVKQVEGRVEAVDLANNVVKVTEPLHLGKIALKVESATQIRGPQGQTVGLSSIKEGDRIWASYHKKGAEHVADRIGILAHGAPKPYPAAPSPKGGPPGGGAVLK